MLVITKTDLSVYQDVETEPKELNFLVVKFNLKARLSGIIKKKRATQGLEINVSKIHTVRNPESSESTEAAAE